MKKFAPVVLFVYNRPIHTRELLNELNKSKLAHCTDLFVYSDGNKSDKDLKEVLEVRKVINDFSNICRFQYYKVILSKTNQGLANSVINGVTDVINCYGKVIVLEDDLSISNSFLEFMNGSLEYYYSHENIWSIAGYTFPINFLQSYNHDIYFTRRESSWGWATWKNRWEKVDWEVKGYSKFKWNMFERHRFAEWGKDLPLMLDVQMCSNKGNSWAIRWCYEQFKHQGLTVYPRISLVKNNGNDGSGTHGSTLVQKFDTIIDMRENAKFTFECLPVEEEIKKAYVKKYFTNWWGYFKTLVWDVLLRLNIIKVT